MSKVPKEEKTLLKVHICNTDLEVVAPVNEEQNYLEAAEYLNQKIDTYARVYASQKPLITIILLAALEIAHNSLNFADLVSFYQITENNNSQVSHILHYLNDNFFP